MCVYAAGISVKLGAHYPGRSHGMPIVLPSSRGGGMCCEKSAEAIVARVTTGEGPNFVLRAGAFVVRVTGDLEGRFGISGAFTVSTGRNLERGRKSESRHPLTRNNPVPEQAQLMERVVAREHVISSRLFSCWIYCAGLERY